ncbi:phosphotransferase [Patescibacteria group bacterium]|nr:phosphotransferase [Patescibacteria group bacterium]
MLTYQKIPGVALRKIFAHFELGKILKTESLATSGNISYLVKTANKTYFLRLCPLGPRWRSQGEISAEIELLHYLKKNNFPVIVPIKSKDNQEVISWKNHYGYLREFTKAKAKLNPSLLEIEKFGETLGWFHSLVENYKTKKRRQHSFDLAETQKYFKQKKNKILKSNFKNKKDFVERYEKEIFTLNFPASLPCGMIHEDLGRRHVLWQGSKIAAVVDFDRSYFGQLILDLGEAIRGWCFVDGWQKWSKENFTALAEGYQRRRKLTDLEKHYLSDAIKFGILERALAFCQRFVEVTQDSEDQKFALNSVFRQIDLVSKEKAAQSF